MEGERLMIPIGVYDFDELREGGFYYVDKSELISDIVNDLKKVFLFTRPRRFGKSLNLSMLDCFFNLKYRGNNWFDGLKVMDDPHAVSMMNTVPVIKLDMKDLTFDSVDEFMADLRLNISELYQSFDYLKDSKIQTSEDMEIYMRGRSKRMDDSEMRNSLRLLSRMLHVHHGIKPIILIDEYDRAINDAFGLESHAGILSFLGQFYSRTFKGNTDMWFAVVTGIMQIAKESIFSGLNNLEVNNVLSTECDERFGFTASEVRRICEDYGRPDAFETAREWYDGYRFGDAEIYNPWSVLKFAKRFETKTYWANTSGNEIVDTMIGRADDEVYRELLELGNGKTKVNATITETITMNDLFTNRSAIDSILVMSGYLNAVPNGHGYDLSIPNKEMYKVFADAMISRRDDSLIADYHAFFDALQTKDIPRMEKCAFRIFEGFQDWDLVDERSYRQILASGAMCCCGKYTVSTEGQAGNGRADMLMRRNTPAVPNIVIEFKKSKSDDEKVHIKEAEDAIRQIKDREYFLSLRGRTLLYGIVFDNKKATILLEEMDL